MADTGGLIDGGDAIRQLPSGAGERLLAVLLGSVALAVTLIFACILYSLMRRGLAGVTPAFLLGTVRDAGRAGGIFPIILSTVWILAVCLAVTIPLGLATAILLAEAAGAGGALGRSVRLSLDVLAGVPSIVFALFGNAFFCVYLGFGFSILAGGLTLGCMVLPFWIRVAEDSLRALPQDYRLAAAALGMSRIRLTFHVLLPAAARGLFVGLVLIIGRALSETAPLLLTSGYVSRMPGSVMDSGRSLAVHVYDLSMNVPGGEAHAASTALVLVVMLLVLNSGVTWLGERFFRHRVFHV